MGTQERQFVLISGLSGAGKLTAMRALEDRGFFCVDNLPAFVLAGLLEGLDPEVERVAVACDIRSRSDLGALAESVESLASSGAWTVRIVFIEASDAVLVARYKESRRRHPLTPNGRVETGVDAERALLAPVRERATEVIDTSAMSAKQLATRMDALGQPARFGVVVQSFGFRHGVPRDADIVWDVRFLPNPYYDPAMRLLSGLDAPVREYVTAHGQGAAFLASLSELLTQCLPAYRAEGKQQLVVAIGCTGGQHRSVSIAEALAETIADEGDVRVEHRDLEANLADLRARHAQ